MYEFSEITFNIPDNVVAVIFYLIIAFFTLTSAMALYSLVRYGKNTVVAVAVSITYIVLAGALFITARTQLGQL